MFIRGSFRGVEKNKLPVAEEHSGHLVHVGGSGLAPERLLELSSFLAVSPSGSLLLADATGLALLKASFP